MQKTRSPLLLGCPVRFHDRWLGRLTAFDLDEAWEVINVVISRGLLRKTSVKLPFSAVSRWEDSSLAVDTTSYEAFARALPPLAVPARTLSRGTAVDRPGIQLVGALVKHGSRRATHLLLAHGSTEPRLAAREHVSLAADVIHLGVRFEDLPIYRSDEDLLLRIRHALASQPYLTPENRRHITVEVADGTVTLAGNVSTPQARLRAVQAAASVDGILNLRDQLKDDIHLEIEIGRVLEQAHLFHQAQIYIHSHLGEVTLYGFAPSTAVAEEIARVVSGVPGVRSVIPRMEVGEGAREARTAERVTTAVS